MALKATGVSRPIGTMFRVMTSEPFMAHHPRSVEFAGRRFDR